MYSKQESRSGPVDRYLLPVPWQAPRPLASTWSRQKGITFFMLYIGQRMLRHRFIAARIVFAALFLSLTGPFPAHAQEDSSNLFLPLLPQYWGDDGARDLTAAGRLNTGLAYPEPNGESFQWPNACVSWREYRQPLS